MTKLTEAQLVRLGYGRTEQERERFERALHRYANCVRSAKDQPPYMPELRAIFMAVRETYKGGMGKGQTVDHMWCARGMRPRRRNQQKESCNA